LTDLIAEVFGVKFEGPYYANPGRGQKFDSKIANFVPASEWLTEEHQRGL
jgi:hypothetical protein